MRRATRLYPSGWGESSRRHGLGWTMIASGSPPMMAVANGNRPLVVVNNTGRVPSAPLAEGGEGQMANAYGAGKQP